MTDHPPNSIQHHLEHEEDRRERKRDSECNCDCGMPYGICTCNKCCGLPVIDRRIVTDDCLHLDTPGNPFA